MLCVQLSLCTSMAVKDRIRIPAGRFVQREKRIRFARGRLRHRYERGCVKHGGGCLLPKIAHVGEASIFLRRRSCRTGIGYLVRILNYLEKEGGLERKFSPVMVD